MRKILRHTGSVNHDVTLPSQDGSGSILLSPYSEIEFIDESYILNAVIRVFIMKGILEHFTKDDVLEQAPDLENELPLSDSNDAINQSDYFDQDLNIQILPLNLGDNIINEEITLENPPILEDLTELNTIQEGDTLYPDELKEIEEKLNRTFFTENDQASDNSKSDFSFLETFNSLKKEDKVLTSEILKEAAKKKEKDKEIDKIKKLDSLITETIKSKKSKKKK